MRRQYRIETTAIDVRDRTLDVRALEDSDRSCLRALYSERAKRTTGNLDRNDWAWNRQLDPPPWMPSVVGYLAVRDEHPEGYVVFSQKTGDSYHDNAIAITDFVAQSLGR